MSRSPWKLTLVSALVVAGCAQLPPRFAVVNRQEWAAVQPLSLGQAALVAPFARQHGLNLILDDDQLIYAAPELDVTLVLLGKEARPVRAGERLGRVDLQAVLRRTREGIAEHERLFREFSAKQAELDRLQRAFIAARRTADSQQVNLEAQAQSSAMQPDTVVRRYRALQSELAAHVKQATLAILDKLKPEVEALAEQHRLDAVLVAPADGRQLHYRRQTPFPPPAIDLTEALIRLHDQHVP